MTTAGERKFVAPDGGWGWVVVFAYIFSNIIIFPLLQSFGLLYRDVFIELQFSAADISIIINFNSAFGLMLGLFMGPLLKVFGYRKVAMGGSLLFFTGYALCTTSTNFTHFMIYYGIINAAGFSATGAAYGLALNTYFDRKRNIASGLSTAVTGLGPVIMPVIISFLLGIYGVRGAGLIVSALILHSFAGALLLQPVSWHARQETEQETDIQELQLLKPKENAVKIMLQPAEIGNLKGIEENNEEEDEETEDIVDDIHSVLVTETPVIVPAKSVECGRKKRLPFIEVISK